MDKVMTVPEATPKTERGARVSVYVREGYKNWQETGTLVRYEGEYLGTTYYMDNSVEGKVRLDSGKVERVVFDGPHGDLCF